MTGRMFEEEQEKMMGTHGDNVELNEGAGLTLPMIELRLNEAEEMVLPKGTLEMKSHMWRPPWLGRKHWLNRRKRSGIKRSGCGNDGSRFAMVVERDKRKPPWRQVVAE